jgi:hypothetical protein
MKSLFREMVRGGRALLRRIAPPAATAPAPIEPSVQTPVVASAPQPRRITLDELAAFGDEKVVVFFAPEGGLVPHFMAHCVVAKTLQERGHRVLMVRCFDVYPRCIVMDAEGLPQEMSEEQRRSVCTMCNGHSTAMTGSYGLDVVDLRDLIDAKARLDIEQLMTEIPDNLSAFEAYGIRFGQLCVAEAAVVYKKTDFSDPALRALVLRYVKGSLLSYHAMRRLIDTIGIQRVVHFNEYSILLSAALAALQSDIPATNMTLASIRGVDRRRLVFFPDPLAIVSYRNRLKQWDRWRNLPLPAATIAEVTSDSLFRMSGNSAMVYSPVRTGSVDDLFTTLRLSPERRLLVAFTSSLDEIAANKEYLAALNYGAFSDKQPFLDQVEWLQGLISRVEGSSDLQLVVRIHPREGANRRESVVSGHLAILQQHFSGQYNHVRIVWPGDAVSSYDLMELADVGLSAWSSTALEMARFGVPSVIAFDRHTPLPVGDVVAWSDNREGYFRCLDQALKRGPSLEQIGYAYRWTHLHILGCAVDFGDVIPDSNFGSLPPYKNPAGGEFVEEVLIGGRSALELNHERLLAAQGSDAAAKEKEELLRQLRRCIWFLCTGRDRDTDYRLFYGLSPGNRIPAGYDALLSEVSGFIEFCAHNETVRRRSRMVQRLAALSAHNAQEAAAA